MHSKRKVILGAGAFALGYGVGNGKVADIINRIGIGIFAMTLIVMIHLPTKPKRQTQDVA